MAKAMTVSELRQMQGLPLEVKICKTKKRIEEWYNYYNGQVYVSFSGGKDSTVLVDIVGSMYPDVPLVFSDTGLEYPEIKEFVKKYDNVEIIRPEVSFKQVIDQYGYPVVSKAVANSVRFAKKNRADGKDTLRLRQLQGKEVGSKFNKGKWEYLLDAPFNISEQCCNKLKKEPLKKYGKLTGRVPIIATMSEEGGARAEAYLKTGCNAYNIGKSQPMGFWTEQDILEYIYTRDLEICSVYGEVVKDDKGKFTLTGVGRTGCLYCMFGVHLEKSPNRFEQLKETHPKLYDYCIYHLGCGEVLDYIGVKY